MFLLSTLLSANGTALAQTPVSIAPNSWGAGSPMPTALMGPFTGVINNKIYVVGGENGSTVFGLNQVYDPASDTWTTGSPMPTPRAGGASAVVNGILYTIGGQTQSA